MRRDNRIETDVQARQAAMRAIIPFIIYIINSYSSLRRATFFASPFSTSPAIFGDFDEFIFAIIVYYTFSRALIYL